MTAFDEASDSLTPWVWTARAIDLTEYDGQIDGYVTAHAEILDGDVGTWTLTLPLLDEDGGIGLNVLALLTEGAGVVARPDGKGDVLFSGQVTHQETTYNGGGEVDTVTFTGPTDEVELASELAWPDPTHWLNDVAGNNVVSGHVDARTGVAETVLLAYVKANLGSTAFHDVHVDRRRAYLTIPATAGHGTSGTYQANFDSLLDIARTICRTGGITWSLKQDTPGTLAMAVRARADVSADVVFSRAEGSLSKATFIRDAPRVTQGISVTDDGTTRSYALATDAAAEALWGRRFVAYGDGGTDIIADLLTAAGQLIADGIETAGAAIEAVVLPDAALFGVDYQLGDMVTVVDASGFSIVDRLTQMTYDHPAGAGPTLVPSVGISQADQESALVPLLRDLTKRLRTLERRR